MCVTGCVFVGCSGRCFQFEQHDFVEYSKGPLDLYIYIYFFSCLCCCLSIKTEFLLLTKVKSKSVKGSHDTRTRNVCFIEEMS